MAIGSVDDVTIAGIIATGATVDELAEALAWIEPMMNAGRPLATGRSSIFSPDSSGRVLQLRRRPRADQENNSYRRKSEGNGGQR